MNLFSLFLVPLLAAFFSFEAHAQDNRLYVADDRTKLDAVTEREVTIIKSSDARDYLNPTLDNLSKLYWKLGAFDMQDEKAIDNYLLINECDIYQNFVNDDIEWLGVREKAKKSIAQDANKISGQFKFSIPVYLGSYDAQKGGFELVNNSGFPALKRMEFLAPVSYERVCEKYINVPNYQDNLMLIFDKPFDLTFLQLDHHVAQAFIIRHKEKVDEATEKRAAPPNRVAHARILMDIKQYNGVISRGTDGDLAVLYGEIKGVEFFEDQNQKILLQSYIYEDEKLVPLKMGEGE